MAKTKAQLEKELKEIKQEYAEGAHEYAETCKNYNAVVSDRKDWIDKYRKLAEEFDQLEDKRYQLAKKHDAFVENYRTERQATVDRWDQLKAKATAQEARLMVAETAMRSMTIHIMILEKQKGD
jgi:sugar-specific transcriptional regulator TrmB